MLTNIANIFIVFIFFYPLIMALVWISGGILFYLKKEGGGRVHPQIPPRLPYYPGVSVLVPCYNEELNIYETIYWLDKLNYPKYEIIAINDGSSDETVKLLVAMAKQFKRLRVVDLTTNQGKAMALRMGTLAAKYEYIVGIDGDAILDPNALTWLMQPLLKDKKCGAVTGMPLVRTRSTLIGKIQVGEFSSIIGIIKRTQNMLGYLFTVSGVVAAFRKSALHDVGYWNLDMITEDIDISWRLQIHGWNVEFEPNAICWILCPETIKGLWKQRVRWAQGGAEAALRHTKEIFKQGKKSMWLMLADYYLSVLWAYLMVISMTSIVLSAIIFLNPNYLTQFIPNYQGVLLALVCLCQFMVSMYLNSRYEKGSGRYFYWLIWYPVIFWMLGMLTTVVAVPKAIKKGKNVRAIWTSPDRGIG